MRVSAGARRACRAVLLALGLGLLLSLSPRPTWAGPVQLDGVLDLGLVLDTSGNKGATPDRRVAGLTTQVLDRLPVLNVLSLGARLTLGGFHARLALAAGNGINVLHTPHPALPAPSPAWRYFLEANAGYTVPIGRGLTIDAGIFPSYIGYESYLTRDNWGATHSWLAELSPFYQAGVRIGYPLTRRLSLLVLWLNGWNLVDQDHGFRSGGAQLAWTADVVSAAVNLFIGPARPGDLRHVRWFGDLWVRITPLKFLQFAVSVDAGIDPRPDGAGNDTWYGVAAYLRLKPLSWFAVSVRAGLYDDTDSGLLSGLPQRLTEVSLTSEFSHHFWTVRLEGRIDRSTGPKFDGQTGRELFVLSWVGGF